MTAQGNTLHKLSIHQIHSAFRFTFSISKFLTVLCSWIMEKDLQSFRQQGRLLLVSFCRLKKPQRCLKVIWGNNGTQISLLILEDSHRCCFYTLTSSNNKILSFCFIGYFLQTQILYLRAIIPHKASCGNYICSCTLHFFPCLSSYFFSTCFVWLVLYIYNCFAISLHRNNFPSQLLCSFYWLHLSIFPPDLVLLACKNACPIVDVAI